MKTNYIPTLVSLLCARLIKESISFSYMFCKGQSELFHSDHEQILFRNPINENELITFRFWYDDKCKITVEFRSPIKNSNETIDPDDINRFLTLLLSEGKVLTTL